jgi:hypothetical protein
MENKSTKCPICNQRVAVNTAFDLASGKRLEFYAGHKLGLTAVQCENSYRRLESRSDGEDA